MDESQREADEFFRGMLAVQDDPEYENEWVPSYYFQEIAGEQLGLEVSNREENDDDPPDYFYEVDGTRIGMEITSLLSGEVMQQNAHYKRIESAMESKVPLLKQGLPPGKYQLNFFPGKPEEVAPGFKIDVAVLGNRIAQQDIDPRVTECMNELVKSFAGKSVAGSLTSRKGDLIGTLRLVLLIPADQVEIYILPQGAYVIEDWTPEKFQVRLQKCVDEKEEQYGGGNLTEIIGLPVWLLISDTRDIMSTSEIEFDIANIALNSRSFERIFFIAGIPLAHHLTELGCSAT